MGGLARYFVKVRDALSDLDSLVFGDGREFLGCRSARPADLQSHDLGRLSQPDVLLQGRGTEGAAAAHRSIDRARGAAFVLHHHLYASADGTAIGLDPLE